MKNFNIFSKTEQLDFATIECVVLGEEGRNRKKVLIPCSSKVESSFELYHKYLIKRKVQREPEEIKALAAQEEKREPIITPAGRRKMQPVSPHRLMKEMDIQYVSIDNSNGYIKLVPGGEDDEKWLARINTLYTYTRNTLGFVAVPPEYKEKVKLLARGKGAWGIAGRIGTWYDYLLEIKDNTWIRVIPSGGRSKINRYWLFFSNDNVYRINDGIEFQIFCDMYNTSPQCKPEECIEIGQ